MALIHAAENGNHEMVRFLLDQGAHIEAGIGGETALYIAAKHGHDAVVQVLLDYGARAEKKNCVSPLAVALQ